MIKACFSPIPYAYKTAIPKLIVLDQKLSAMNNLAQI